jgi:hypothetical protein
MDRIEESGLLPLFPRAYHKVYVSSKVHCLV